MRASNAWRDEPGGTLSHVYFPTTAIVSLLYVMQNGESGRIRVLDRGGLEKRTCEGNAVVKKEYDRLLPHQLAA
jgi:hypothetical protein